MRAALVVLVMATSNASKAQLWRNTQIQMQLWLSATAVLRQRRGLCNRQSKPAAAEATHQQKSPISQPTANPKPSAAQPAAKPVATAKPLGELPTDYDDEGKRSAVIQAANPRSTEREIAAEKSGPGQRRLRER